LQQAPAQAQTTARLALRQSLQQQQQPPLRALPLR
jgi:hypothetical protein